MQAQTMRQALDELARDVGARWDEARAGAYCRVLGKLPEWAVIRACEQKADFASRMPTSGELRILAAEIAAEEQARNSPAARLEREETILWSELWRRRGRNWIPSEGCLFRLASELGLHAAREHYRWALEMQDDGVEIPESARRFPDPGSVSGPLSFSSVFPEEHPMRRHYDAGRERAKTHLREHPPSCDCLERGRGERRSIGAQDFAARRVREAEEAPEVRRRAGTMFAQETGYSDPADAPF